MSIAQRIKQWPLIRSWLRQRALKRFLSPAGVGYHAGRFRTFDEARAWLPPTPGFVHEDFTAEYIHQRSQAISSFDYPVMLWLERAFESGARSLLDIGGSVGNQFYAYQRYLGYPSELRWCVYELPAFIAQGRELAERRGAQALQFTDELHASATDSDIWMAAGVLEFMEDGQLPQLLDRATRRPTHIILNKLPLHDGPDFVSTQNIGHGSFVPHWVYHRETFIQQVVSRGYALVDAWDVHERAFNSLGAAQDAFDSYSGLYFRATTPA